VTGPTAPDSWLERLQRSSFQLLLAAIALMIAWRLLRQLLVPLVVIAVLLGILRLALGWWRRDSW
jgi:hypothetical protein